VTPLSQRCAGCDAQGTSWIDLRLCLSCGEVGCCDSSPWQHASKHAKASDHPVMRSFMPGEDWRWCYVDELLG
jgi:CPA1 family monovalent cation:H+ antiporter